MNKFFKIGLKSSLDGSSSVLIVMSSLKKKNKLRVIDFSKINQFCDFIKNSRLFQDFSRFLKSISKLEILIDYQSEWVALILN